MNGCLDTHGKEQECSFLDLSSDGSILLMLAGRRQWVQLHGVELRQPPSQECLAWFDRSVRQPGKPLRFLERGRTGEGRISAQLFHFGWHDKSGDVWMDLAITLLRLGFARVSPGDFPEKQEYLRQEKR